jgi:nicotinamide mononucleotide (NMN) deamidase PncC
VIAGGAVVYQTPMKERILGLKNVTDDNVVSRDVANYMAVEAAKKFGTDAAIATTGYLEPWKGRKVVTYVSLLWPGSGPFCKEIAEEEGDDGHFDRYMNRDFAVDLALDMLSERLQ